MKCDVRAPDNWEQPRSACQNCWTTLRKISVARQISGVKECSFLAIYNSLAALMRDIEHSKVAGASEQIISSLMKQLAQSCASLKNVKGTTATEDALIQAIVAQVTQFYTNHRIEMK